jgi:hypothetical protein
MAAIVLSAPAAAQECGIRRFGGTTSFSTPVETVGALQAMFKEKEDEIARMLGRAGWEGSPGDLQAAIARGATKQVVTKGTRFEWVFRRVNGTPDLLKNECYGGAEPVDAWAVDVESRGRRWHFVVPAVCGNVALVGSEALPAQQAQAQTEPQPPPRTAPPPAPPPEAAPPPPAPPPAAAPPPPVAPPRAPAPSAAPAPPSAPAVEPESPRPTWNFEVFAGYFFPEELDEDLTYGLRFGRRYVNKWGWQLGGSWFDVADSQGFSGQDVDADVVHVDLSAMYYPRDGGFSFFFGPGFASGNVDVPGTTEEISDDVFSAHVGIGYEFGRAARAGQSSFFVKPDARLRWYELEGFGEDGGRDNQLTYEATIAFGWRFGG